MSLATMYMSKAGSPKTTLAAALAAADTSMTLTDASVLPAAPNLAVIGSDSGAEVVSYTAITGNVVSGLVRGLGGTVASAWSAGEEVARNITSLDHDTFRANILDLDTRVPVNTTADRFLHYDGTSYEWKQVDLSSNDTTGNLPIANGGTNATTAADARTNLGLGDLAVEDDASSDGILYGRKNGAWVKCAGKSTARTITVGPSGRDFTGIQDAIDSIYPGEIVTIEVDANTDGYSAVSNYDDDYDEYTFLVDGINVSFDFANGVTLNSPLKFNNSTASIKVNTKLYLTRLIFASTICSIKQAANNYTDGIEFSSQFTASTSRQDSSIIATGSLISIANMGLYFSNAAANCGNCFYCQGSFVSVLAYVYGQAAGDTYKYEFVARLYAAIFFSRSVPYNINSGTNIYFSTGIAKFGTSNLILATGSVGSL